jgi:hypothetical protein
VSLPAEVREKWTEWNATPLPVDNFLSGDVRALTYGIECDLDHHASYVIALIDEFQAGNPRWEFQTLATTKRAELHELKERIRALELPEHVAAAFERYTDATDQLLLAVSQHAPGTGLR